MATRNRKVPFWEVLENFDRGTPARDSVMGFTNTEDSANDARKYVEVMKMTALIWYDLHPGDERTKVMQLKPWYNFLVSNDFHDVLGAFKVLSDIWIESCNLNFPDFSGSDGYTRFKAYMNAYNPYCGTIMAPMRVVVNRWFSEGLPADFGILRQAFCFPLRINFDSREDLIDQARTRYLANEERLQSLVLPDIDLSDRIGAWFPTTMNEIYDWWHPSHGSGTVADLRGKNLVEKYHALRCDEKLSYLSRRLPHTMAEGWLPNYMAQTPPLDRTAEVLFVPKSWDKLRTICRECTTLQWYQQGFRRSICDVIDTYTYMGGKVAPNGVRKQRFHPLHNRIRLRHSEQNRNLACEGSIDGSLDTIDLSDASDSVSFALVRSAFRKSVLLPVAFCCRSSVARCPGVEAPLQLQKFAPMGSALCFPFMCILFAAMCEEAIERVSGKQAIRSSRYSVYGDDIVIEHRYVDTLVQLLSEFGFLVNKDKSCSSQLTNAAALFRESCGGEFLDGVDVTPLRISRRYTALSPDFRRVSRDQDISSSDARALVALVDLANQTESLRTLRQYLIKKVLVLPPHLRPCFTLDGSVGIKSSQPTNFQLSAPRYHADYQRWVWRCGHSVCKNTVIGDCEEIRLLESLRAASQRTPDAYLAPEKYELTTENTVAWVCRAEYNLFGDDGSDANPTTMLTSW